MCVSTPSHPPDADGEHDPDEEDEEDLELICGGRGLQPVRPVGYERWQDLSAEKNELSKANH